MSYKIGMSIGTLIIIITLMIGLALSLSACATPQEDIALARMRQADAEARKASAEGARTVNVLREQANVHTEAMRTEADISMEKREFELQLERDKLRLHREETVNILTESQALIVTLKENRAIAENTRAAAENSYWILLVGVPLIGMNLGLLVFVIFLVLRRQ